MAISIFDNTIKETLSSRFSSLEQHFTWGCHILLWRNASKDVRKCFVILLRSYETTVVNKDTLVILLNTPGGSVETVEKMVDIIRHHYKKVIFLLFPTMLSVSGCYFCMPGDKIFMDYHLPLGQLIPRLF